MNKKLQINIKRLNDHPNKFKWTNHFRALLGKISDQQLAKMAGIHPQTVTNERLRLGVKAYKQRRKPIKWDTEMIKLLGTASDRDVAEELGINHRSVFRKRKILGIHPFNFKSPMKNQEDDFWTSHNIALLGTASDREIAKKLEIFPEKVHLKRRELSIQPFNAPIDKIVWTEEMIRSLGKIPDIKFVKIFPMTLFSVYRKRKELGIAPYNEMTKKVVRDYELKKLLQLSNREVIENTKLSKSTILKLRREFLIPAPNNRRWRWTSEIIDRLGKESDEKIAKTMSITSASVCYIRRAMGIRAYCQKKPWSKDEITLLGTETDKKVSEQLNRSYDQNSVN
jgi:hypothetical protein